LDNETDDGRTSIDRFSLPNNKQLHMGRLFGDIGGYYENLLWDKQTIRSSHGVEKVLYRWQENYHGTKINTYKTKQREGTTF